MYYSHPSGYSMVAKLEGDAPGSSIVFDPPPPAMVRF